MKTKLMNYLAHQTVNIYLTQWMYSKICFNIPWVGDFVIKHGQIVGTGSFSGQPIDGNVEIAYWTFKQFEGQGVATFICKELISIAKKQTQP